MRKLTPVSWVGVPIERLPEWRAAFHNIHSLFVPHACPICSEISLRQYYYLGKEELRDVRGVRFRGRGSYWAWCAHCGTYEHASSLVPEAWTGPILPVDHASLTPIPEALEKAVTQTFECDSSNARKTDNR